LAEKVAKEIGLEKRTIVECDEPVLIEGDLNSSIWILKTNDDLRVAVRASEYIATMQTLKDVMKENFELKLEKAILSEFPIDYEDVKAVVLEKLKESDKSLEEVVEEVKLEHPNLFYNLELDKIF
jgi:hypothetical protein